MMLWMPTIIYSFQKFPKLTMLAPLDLQTLILTSPTWLCYQLLTVGTNTRKRAKSVLLSFSLDGMDLTRLLTHFLRLPLTNCNLTQAHTPFLYLTIKMIH